MSGALWNLFPDSHTLTLHTQGVCVSLIACLSGVPFQRESMYKLRHSAVGYSDTSRSLLSPSRTFVSFQQSLFA
jgi:hypothetical protein